MNIECPCCGYFTIDSEDEVIVEICPVCFWQYDEVAHINPDEIIGANHVSMNEAKKNFKKYGASEKQFQNKVRQPLFNELPENNE